MWMPETQGHREDAETWGQQENRGTRGQQKDVGTPGRHGDTGKTQGHCGGRTGGHQRCRDTGAT